MRSISFGLAVSLAALVVAAPLAALAQPPSDLMCPRAVPKLVEFQDASGGKDITKILSASRGAADAYLTCLSEAKTRFAEEPYMNYDRTRAAQFLVVEARALTATGDTKSATAALHDAHRLADEVVTWLPMSQTYSQSSGTEGNSADRNTDRNGSRYKASAKEILAAADDELAKITGSVHRQAPAPSSSP